MMELILKLLGLVFHYLLYYYLLAFGYILYKKMTTLPAGSVINQLKQKKLMIVFGSGGHTTEMLLMLTKKNTHQFDFTKYKEVQFVIGHSDTWSLTKIKDYFANKQNSQPDSKVFDIEKDVPNLRIVKVFRSREVKQSYLTSVLTTLIALAHSVFIVAKNRPDIVITNGPGTAVPVCYAHFALSKILLWNLAAKILFVESFCRVTSLSLSGKLLYPIASKFIVHWEELKIKHPRSILFKEKII